MKFDELIAKVRAMAGKLDVSGVDFLAVQITMNMSNFNKLIDGKLDPVAAFTLGKLKVDGDIGKALEFGNLLKK